MTYFLTQSEYFLNNGALEQSDLGMSLVYVSTSAVMSLCIIVAV